MALKKKYIKMADGDFKKAWRLQKRKAKSRKRKRRKTKVKSTRRRSRKVAKKKSYRRRSSKGMFRGQSGKLFAAAAYGALRAKIAQTVDPLTKNIPIAGTLSDNVAMLSVGWVADKFVGRKVPMVREIAKQGMIIEAAQIGQELAAGAMAGSGLNKSGGKYPV